MSCTHARTNDDLPCAWPSCPDGTPQETVVLMRGEEAVVTASRHHSLKIEADGGAEMYRRRQNAGGWEWIPA